MPVNFKETKFGFEWGPMSIERHIENKGSVILSLKTAKVDLDVYVTPSGEVKMFVPTGNSISVVGSGRLNEKQKM